MHNVNEHLKGMKTAVESLNHSLGTGNPLSSADVEVLKDVLYYYPSGKVFNLEPVQWLELDTFKIAHKLETVGLSMREKQELRYALESFHAIVLFFVNVLSPHRTIDNEGMIKFLERNFDLTYNDAKVVFNMVLQFLVNIES